VGSTLACGDCHVAHTPDRAASLGTLARPRADAAELEPELRRDDVGPLLKKDINDLCLSCHDGSSRAPDVLGINHGSRPSAVRQGGYLNMIGTTGSPGTGHTLGATDPAPGSTPPWTPEDEKTTGGLDCIHCHAHHGSREAYRNLRSDAGQNLPGEGLVTYNRDSPGVRDPSRDVFVRRSLDYDESAVDFNEPVPDDSAIARFCAGCHGEFHGVPGSKQIGGRDDAQGFVAFRRHPAAGVDIGAVGGERSSLERFRGHATRVKVMSASGSWSSPGADVTPTCITCHKAHGNGNAFGLILRSGRGSPTEDGDTDGSALRDLCGQCHVQGSPFAEPWNVSGSAGRSRPAG